MSSIPLLACADERADETVGQAQHRRSRGDAAVTEATVRARSILFVPFPAHGHVNPLLPVVSELVDRGAEVEVIVSDRFTAPFRAAGARVRTTSFDVRVRVPEWPGPIWAARYGWELLRRHRSGRGLDSCGDAPPDLAVIDPMATWGTTWARRRGLRWIPLHTTRVRRAGSADALIAVLPELQSNADRLPANQVCTGPLLRPVTGDMARDMDLPWHRIEEGPTVLVSPGTVYARRPRFFAAVADAFAGTDWLVVMSTGPTGGAGEMSLPPNVIARPHLPQLAVLEHADAFVTHAGMNSVQEALAYAVPMVLTPRSREQRDTAARIVELGAGVPLRGHTPRPADVFAAVTTASSDPSIRANLNRLQRRVRAIPSAALAATTILRLAGRQ